MTTLNTRKVGDEFQYDPYTEYQHPQAPAQEEVVQEQSSVLTPVIQDDLQQGKARLIKNIDDMFDGADFVFDIANKFFKRLGGK